MPNIPIGNFGNLTRPVPPRANTAPLYDAVSRLGDVVSAQATKALEQQNVDARNTAANVLLDHELAVRKAGADINLALTRGDITPDQARPAYEAAVKALPDAPIPHLEGAAADALSRGRQRAAFAGGLQVDESIAARRLDIGKAQVASAIDSILKMGNLPGSNPAVLADKIAALAPMARQNGIPEDRFAPAMQAAKDTLWFNYAHNKTILASDSTDALTAIEKDLTSGQLSMHLDPDKRDALLGNVRSQQAQLEAREIARQARRDAQAEHAVRALQMQSATGMPLNVADVAQASSMVRGTPSALEFRAMLDQQDMIQSVLRLPPADQISYIQQQKAASTADEAAFQAKLGAAVKSNVELLEKSPVLWAQQRLGVQVTPISPAMLLTPQGLQVAAAELTRRGEVNRGLARQYPGVKNAPLLPQEVAGMVDAIDRQPPDVQAQVLGGMAGALDRRDFIAMMAQLGPGAPVTATAGALAQKQTELVTGTHWFVPDDKIASMDVAATMLHGQALIKTKEAKAYLPDSDADLWTAFVDRVGNAFAGKERAMQAAYQSTRAYYVGAAAKQSRYSTKDNPVNSDVLGESVAMVLGNIIETNRKQNLAPWGMSRADAETRMDQHISARAALEPNPAAWAAAVTPVSTGGEGRYQLYIGNRPVPNNGIVDLTVPIAAPTYNIRGMGGRSVPKDATPGLEEGVARPMGGRSAPQAGP